MQQQFFRLSRIARDILAVSTTKIDCEKVFSIVDNFYNRRNSYDFQTFSALMIVRCHDEKQNKRLKFHANLKNDSKNVKSIQIIETEMKTRLNNLKNSVMMQYISDGESETDDEKTESRKFKIKKMIFCIDVFIIDSFQKKKIFRCKKFFVCFAKLDAIKKNISNN